MISCSVLTKFGNQGIPGIGVPWPILLGVVTLVIFYIIMKFMAFGRLVIATSKGSVMRTLVGVLALGLIGNIMNLLSVPAYPQQIIKGAIIIVAVFLQDVSSKRVNM